MNQNRRLNPFPVSAPYDGIYSHAVETSLQGRFLHISGQIGMDLMGELKICFRAQAIQSINNVSSILEYAGMALNDIVHMKFYLVDSQHIDELTDVRKTLLGGVAPSVTTLIVNGLVNEDWLIETEATAFKPQLKRDGELYARYI